MDITKQIADCLKKYLDGAFTREELKTELHSLHSKMVEAKINMLPDNRPYVTIIHFVTLEIPDLAYSDDEIRYVYHALLGEEGYTLQNTVWFPKSNRELNDTEQKILELSRKYVSNYNANKQYTISKSKSYLEESDIEYIYSLYPDRDKRSEFRNAVELPDFAISQMLTLLMEGMYNIHPEIFDSCRYVAQKLEVLLSSYDNDLPFYSIVTLKNGVTTINII